MSTHYELILETIAQCEPEATPEEISLRVIGMVSESEIRAFAITSGVVFVEKWRREQARQIEDRAIRQQEQGYRDGVVDFPCFRDTYYRPGYVANCTSIGNKRKFAAFQKWMGEDFESWKAARLTDLVTAGDPEEAECFQWDMLNGQSSYHSELVFKRMERAIEEYGQSIRLQVTSELLNTIFALGDGTKTTWGDATVEQHRIRIQMLTSHAAGTIETAGRHDAAIRMIQGAGVSSLNETVRIVSAALPRIGCLPN